MQSRHIRTIKMIGIAPPLIFHNKLEFNCALVQNERLALFVEIIFIFDVCSPFWKQSYIILRYIENIPHIENFEPSATQLLHGNP